MANTIWVTGSSRGIGRAIAKRFLDEGNRVIIHAYENELLAREYFKDELASGQAKLIVCDISDHEKLEHLHLDISKSFGEIDILVSNAAIEWFGLLNDMSIAEIDRIVEVNFKGMVYASRLVLPSMIAKKAGNIITISSIYGKMGASCEVLYSSTKAAIIGFTQALAMEVAPSGIRVNCIAPGVIKTDMMARFSESDIKVIAGNVPLSRIGRPEEIADMASFLVSERAAYITGQVFSVDGGGV